jgi:hypothetical protein
MGVRDTANSAFPVDDSIRRLVVPEHDDTKAREAQQTSASALKISNKSGSAKNTAEQPESSPCTIF